MPALPNPDNLTPVPRTRISHADGVINVTGNVSFDLTNGLLAIMTTNKLLSRRYMIDFEIWDGNKGTKLEDCYITSISISGAPAGVMNGSIALMTASTPIEITEEPTWLEFMLREENYQPWGYWYSGRPNIREWTFTFNQEVSPIYSNQNTMYPRYLRVGMLDCNLEVTTYEQFYEYDQVQILTTNFKIVGKTNAKGYSFNGPTDLGMFRHTFESGVDATIGSDDPTLYVW